MRRLVFAAVFLAAVSAAAVDAQRWPPNAYLAPGPDSCVKLMNGADKWAFQTDIIEPSGADRVSARFLVQNRCRTAIRVTGGLRLDGRNITQGGPIEIHAVRKAEGDVGESIGKGSLQSFVVPANGTVAVDGLVMLAAGAVPADVAVVGAAGQYFVHVEGGTRRLSFRGDGGPGRLGETVFCVHYADRRCGDWQ